MYAFPKGMYPTVMGKNVADLLTDRLLDWGVKVIFGFPGDGINGVFESLRHENHLLDSLDDAISHARTHVAHQPH